MTKIRIPRKKKKESILQHYNFPCVPKINRYWSYKIIEYGISHYNMSAEDLYRTFGCYTMDDVIWWAWVRRKHLHIEPKLSEEFQEYWNYFVSEGVIK
jgi:hypothetical protein